MGVVNTQEVQLLIIEKREEKKNTKKEKEKVLPKPNELALSIPLIR